MDELPTPGRSTVTVQPLLRRSVITEVGIVKAPHSERNTVGSTELAADDVSEANIGTKHPEFFVNKDHTLQTGDPKMSFHFVQCMY